MRKSFILHKDSLDVLDDLSDEQAGQLFKAIKAFNNLLKKQPDQKDFTTKLVIDVKARCKSNQLGFAEMHPTTYLNGERWEDTITHRAPLAEERKTTFENLTDRSWADSIIQPKQIGAIYEA